MKQIIIIFLGLVLVSCKTSHTHGQLVNAADIELVNSSHPSKEELISIIGSPTYIPDNADNIWYYIKRVSNVNPLGKTKTAEQQIVKVKFLGNNVAEAFIVDDIEYQDMAINKNSTPSYGDDKGVITKFIGNIGKTKTRKKK